MGVLLDIVKLQQKRDLLFDRYCELLKQESRTQEETLKLYSLAVKISDIDEAVRDANRKAGEVIL